MLDKPMILAGPVLSPQQALDRLRIRAAAFLQAFDYPDLPKIRPGRPHRQSSEFYFLRPTTKTK